MLSLNNTSFSNIISENSGVLKYGSCSAFIANVSGNISTGPIVNNFIACSLSDLQNNLIFSHNHQNSQFQTRTDLQHPLYKSGAHLHL